MDFLKAVGFELFALGMVSDIWIYKHKGEIIYKGSRTISGKFIISDAENKMIVTSREKSEIIDYLTREIRELKLDQIL